MTKDLNFYWRMGDYALETWESVNQDYKTIDLVKYYQHQGKECKYSIGYFYYDEHEPCWELKFVGERFKEILETDAVAVFKMLKAAYDTLEEWSKSRRDD